MDIRCKKLSCKFNNKYTCKAKELGVGEDIICSSFILDEEKKELDNKKIDIFKDKIEFASQRECKNVDILCSCDCLFNRNGKCVANGITISNLKQKPYCVTYLRK